MIFEERGKPEYPVPLGAKERTNNKLNPHMASTQGCEPGHTGGRRVLSPLRHRLFPKELKQAGEER